MSYWEGPSRWINALLLFILGFLGFDAFFRLLGANESNLIVGIVRAVAGVFLAPFNGMFDWQSPLLTTLIAVLGYCLLAGIALAITKSVQASRRDAASRAEDRRRAVREEVAAQREARSERVEDRPRRA
jgi:hypothetical protein